MQRRFAPVAVLITSVLCSAGHLNFAVATPARVNALDGGNFLVPDDWDIANYYHLGAYLKNHLYFYYPLDKKPFGWAMLDLHRAGVLTVWLNRPAAVTPIYQAAGGLGGFGYSNKALGAPAPGVEEWDPQETRVGIPDVKFSLGWGLKLSDMWAIGLCTQLGSLEHSDKDIQPAATSTDILSDATLISAYLIPSGAASSTVQRVGDYESRQRSSSYIVGPSVGFRGESFSIDFTANVILNGIDNSWQATLVPDLTTSLTGTLTNTLKSTAGPSTVFKIRFMMPISEKTTFAVDANSTMLDLSTEHRVTGAFNTAMANYDDRNQSETLIAAPWVCMAGIVSHPSDEYLVVVGAGASGSGITIEDKTYAVRNDAAVLTETRTTITNLNVPVVIGVEYAPKDWLRLRAVGQRNFFGMTTVKSDDGTSSAESSVNDIKDWIFRLGFGLQNERVGWDVLFNLAPNKAAVRSPFFAGPTKVTILSPSITTAVVYKW